MIINYTVIINQWISNYEFIMIESANPLKLLTHFLKGLLREREIEINQRHSTQSSLKGCITSVN